MAVQDPMRWFRQQTAKVTIVLCALTIIGSLITWASPTAVIDGFAYSGLPFPKVWTLFTYPFVNLPSPFFLLLQILWLYFVGSIVERDHGSTKFLYLWLVISVVGAIPMSFFKTPLLGMLVPDAMLVTLWATRYPNMIVRLFMCIPVAAKWIGVLSVATVFFIYASTAELAVRGIMAILGCAVAFFYAKNLIPNLPYGLRHGTAFIKPKPTKAQVAREKEYYDDVFRREKEREERERLRKLFEDSIGDEK
jgi:membrane associated rhomboid family serine protease